MIIFIQGNEDAVVTIAITKLIVNKPCYEMHTKNVKVSNKVKSDGLLPFLEKLHGSNQGATDLFEKNWNNGNLTLFGRNVELNENLIAKVIGLSTDGKKFFRHRVFSDDVVIRFPKKEKERLNLVKISNSYFEDDTIKALWRKVLRVIMEYITVDEHFTRVYGYHFALLNHFHYKVRVLFPYYLFCSLRKNLDVHKKNHRRFPILHTRLIRLIVEHYQKNSVPANLETLPNSKEDDVEPSCLEYFPNLSPAKTVLSPHVVLFGKKKTLSLFLIRLVLSLSREAPPSRPVLLIRTPRLKILFPILKIPLNMRRLVPIILSLVSTRCWKDLLVTVPLLLLTLKKLV